MNADIFTRRDKNFVLWREASMRSSARLSHRPITIRRPGNVCE